MNNESILRRLSVLLDGSKGVICFDDIATHTSAANGGPAALEVENGFLLYSLIKRYKLKHIVETGTNFGYSAAWLAAALADNHETDPHGGKGTVWTTDVDAYDGKASHLWRKLKLSPYIKSYRTASTKLSLDLFPKIDMLFLDSIHTYDYVLEEFEYFMPKLANFSLVVFHDTTLVPELQNAITEIKSRRICRYHTLGHVFKIINHIQFRSMRGLDILIIKKGE